MWLRNVQGDGGVLGSIWSLGSGKSSSAERGSATETSDSGTWLSGIIIVWLQ